jgi:hypothetical protein
VLNHLQECFDEKYIGWIGFDELYIDFWHEIELLVQRNVPADVAWAFGEEYGTGE